MTNWRVIQQRDADGMPYFTIEDVQTKRPPGVSPFVKHIPPYPVAQSIDELRGSLTDMLSACLKPPLVLVITAPELHECQPANPPQ